MIEPALALVDGRAETDTVIMVHHNRSQIQCNRLGRHRNQRTPESRMIRFKRINRLEREYSVYTSAENPRARARTRDTVAPPAQSAPDRGGR